MQSLAMAVYYKHTQLRTLCALKSAMKLKSFRNKINYFPLQCFSHQSGTTPVCLLAETYGERTALCDANGRHSYSSLFKRSQILGKNISDLLPAPGSPNKQQRVALLCPNDASYVISQWASWLCGHVVVPLHTKYPPSLLKYYIDDSQVGLIIVTPELKSKVDGLINKPTQLLVLDESIFANHDSTADTRLVPPTFYSDASALILYTSGTTGPPKGVVLTHKNIEVNIMNMVNSWRWSKNDRILHCLPLHHTHGIVNALLCPFHIGAECIMLPKFDAAEVWERLLSAEIDKRITVFMGVPTMYVKLIEEYEKRYKDKLHTKEFINAFCKQKIRLMISGSAALPTPVFQQWEEITGHKLLERYGMTEIGMALTNPYDGPRNPGYVGNPFENIQIRLIQKNAYVSLGYDVIVEGSSEGSKMVSEKGTEEGELYVKGPTVFKEYWNRQDATKEAFTQDGWFKTGDTAAYVNGMYKIQGRTSVDIIKSGAYKISALDIEHHLLSHPDIIDCAVVGIADHIWGQRVAAIVVNKKGQDLTLPILKEWCKEKMAPYQIPQVLKLVEEIPRNPLGKVNKIELVKSMFPARE